MSALLVVEDLGVSYGRIEAVRGVSFTVGREKIGIVGESGSGKSMTGRAILRLTPPKAMVSARRMEFEGIDLAAASEREMLRVRDAPLAYELSGRCAYQSTFAYSSEG